MTEEEEVLFETLLQKDAEERRQQHEAAAKKLSQADEYEALKLYGDKWTNLRSHGEMDLQIILSRHKKDRNIATHIEVEQSMMERITLYCM